jgi:hypothetical protein
VCRVGDGFLKAPELLGAHLSVVGVLRLDLRVVRWGVEAVGASAVVSSTPPTAAP